MLADIAKIEVDKGLKGLELILTGGASGGTPGGGAGGGGSGGLLGAAGSSIFGGLGSLFSGGAVAGAPLQLAGAVGGAAPAAGAAAGAAGGAGGIFSMLAPFLPFLAAFDSGSWEIPNDMVANVHAGEMIVPAQGGMADNFRSALANGGGGDTHFHFSPQVNAIDRNGVSNFFGNNSGHMLKAFNDAVGRGDHLGFKNLR